jgi:hypothetical protein
MLPRHAGKTTLLRNLLTQDKYKIGCIVNDVAAVNIDAKLIRNRTGGEGKTTTKDLAPTVELQNGCACTLTRPATSHPIRASITCTAFVFDNVRCRRSAEARQRWHLGNDQLIDFNHSRSLYVELSLCLEM